MVAIGHENAHNRLQDWWGGKLDDNHAKEAGSFWKSEALGGELIADWVKGRVGEVRVAGGPEVSAWKSTSRW